MDKPLTVFLAALAHETNSFSPLPTTLRSFEDDILYQPGDGADALALARGFPGYGYVMDLAAARGDSVVSGLCAWAQPGGPVSRHAYEHLRDALLEQLASAAPVAMVALVLHGAMLADGYPDCEGDLLARVREVVGPGIPIGALLDLHGNVTPAMIASGALLIACKEYPHTDYPERSAELYAILSKAARGGAMPRMRMRRVPMLGMFGTTEGPMRDFVTRLHQAEQQPGIVSVSAMHGFPWSDTEATSAAILVASEAFGDDVDIDIDVDACTSTSVADANIARYSGDHTAELAERLSQELFALRGVAVATSLSVDEAISAALHAARDGGLVVIADRSDNPGGGAACDSTFVLRALIERGIDGVALGMLWDPQAVRIAVDAGVGARLPLRIGGKVGPSSGAPLDVLAEVRAIRHDAHQRGLGGHGSDALGTAVAIRARGIDIVLNTKRQQVFSPDCFSELGIDLSAKRIVVVKSTQHFRAGFDAITVATIYCDAPGTLNSQLAALPYEHLRRPMWPLDAFDALPPA